MGAPEQTATARAGTRVRSTINGDALFMDKLVADIEFTLVLAGTEPVTVSAQLTYDRADPYAVCVSFDAGRTERIEWTFARDLLDQGLWVAAGDGDVRVWPRDSTVVMALCSPTGKAILETPRHCVAEFIRRSQLIVAVGSEGEYIDVERELASLLA